MKGLLSTILLAFGMLLYAQEDCKYSISGRVIDEHDGEALAYANILVLENGKGVISDEKGNYKITGLCLGKYTLRCSHLGCEDVIDTLDIRGNMKHDFYPEHHTELLENTVIIAHAKKTESSQKIDVLDNKELAQLRGENLGNSLKSIPGISSLNTGNNVSKPVIHGMHSNRILIMNNGVRHEGQQWGNEHAPEIDPSIAGEITVVKGANSLRYGPDAIAGVILIDPKKLLSDNGLEGDLSITGASNGRQGNLTGLLQGNHLKSKALRWRLQGSLKRGGNLNSPDYYLDNTGVQEQNYSAAIAYSKSAFGTELFYSQFNSEIGIFSGSHIGNLTDLDEAFEADEPSPRANFSYDINGPWQQIHHDLLKSSTYFAFGESNRLEFTYARQYNKRLEFDKHSGYGDSLETPSDPALQFEITTNTGELVFKELSDPWQLTSGISGIYQGNKYQGRFFIPNFYKYGLGAFLIEKWSPESSNWQFEGGLRYDYIRQDVFIWRGETLVQPVHEYQNVSGNLGSIWNFNRDMNLRLNAGLAWRPPNVNEMYSEGLHHGSASVEIGDTSLTEEKAYNISLSSDIKRKKWNVDLGLYYNYIQDYIYLRPIQPPTLTIRGAFPTFQFDQVDADLYGLDASFGLNLTKKLSSIIEVSMVRAYDRATGDHLVLIPADRFNYGLKYTFRDKKTFKSTFVRLTGTHVLEQSRVPENSDYVPPPSSYFLIGMQAATDIYIGKQSMMLSLRIDNLLDQKYRDYMNRLRYFADDMGRNISLSLYIPIPLIKNQKQ